MKKTSVLMNYMLNTADYTDCVDYTKGEGYAGILTFARNAF